MNSGMYCQVYGMVYGVIFAQSQKRIREDCVRQLEPIKALSCRTLV